MSVRHLRQALSSAAQEERLSALEMENAMLKQAVVNAVRAVQQRDQQLEQMIIQHAMQIKAIEDYLDFKRNQ